MKSSGRKMRGFLPGLLVCLSLLTPASTSVAIDSEHPSSLLRDLRTRLIDDGVDPIVVNRYFEDSRFEVIPSLLRLNIRQPSGTEGYQRFLGDASVRTASAFLEINRAEIERALAGGPVSPEIVVAILNVESSLGTYKGTYPLMNVFASLTLLNTDPITDLIPEFWTDMLDGVPASEQSAVKMNARKRAASKARWAYRELKALLNMAEDGHFDPLDVKASWAGAYGLPQFIPTSANAYGRDGDGDGVVNLNSLPDAVASIAHYLQIHGYRDDVPKKRRKAVWHYNHSEEYVDCIITLADRIREYNATHSAP